jgi:VWFA-related protein
MRSVTSLRCIVTATLSVAALVVSLRGQSSLPEQQPPTFRTHTEHVALDVVVTDKNDRPITDLTSADFQITDSGRPQTVADFRLVSVPQTHRTVNLADRPSAPADVAANGQSPDASRAIAFIFDMSLSTADIVPWKREMTHFLENMSPDDQMAVAYVGRSDLGQDFTNDVGRLALAINSLPAAMFAGQIPCGRHPAQCTLIVLDNVVKTLAAAHQSRRFIVLASAWGCIPGPPNPNAQACHDVIEAAKRADVPIYGIGPPGPFQAPPSLQVLATETGGRAFVNTPKLTATTDILADNASYYVLGFYPEPFVADGKFHHVKVAVSRPGAHVRARQGYEAARAADDAPNLGRAMAVSLGPGLDDPTLPIRATVAPIAVTKRGMKALLTVEVAYPTTDANKTDDELQLGVLALDTDAHVRAELQRTVRFSAIASIRGTATFAIDDVIDLPSQQLTLRVGVSSRGLGKTGTVHLPLIVPSATDGNLHLSGIVIGISGAKPLSVLAGNVAAALVPFQPTTARRFAPTDTLRVFARAFWRSQESAVTATIFIDGAGSTPTIITVPATDDSDTLHDGVIDTTIPLTNLTRGKYILTVDARLARGKTARREIPIEVR